MKKETPYPISDTLKHIPNVYQAILVVSQRARELRRMNHNQEYLTNALLEGGQGKLDRQTYLMKSIIEQLTKEKDNGKRRNSFKPR